MIDTAPHPAATAHLDALRADGWEVSVAARSVDGLDVWTATLAKDDTRQVTMAASEKVAVEQAAWHNGARWG